MTLHLDYPFSVDALGRSARTTDEDHVRDLVEQVLFTVPGERVNRPDFGTGVMQLIFAPGGDQLAGAVEYTVQTALQLFLADLITVQTVEVVVEEATLRVGVAYALLPHLDPTADTRTLVLERRTDS
jgi:phage baseplate assembly protein W